MKYADVIDLYKQVFPQTEHEADSGYILRDGTVIDISSKMIIYCHGKEFVTEPALTEWRAQHPELPKSNHLAADVIMNELGAIEFTIDNAHLQCVRLPSLEPTVKQRKALRIIVEKCLERGFIRITALEPSGFLILAKSASDYLVDEQVFIQEDLTVDTVMQAIEGLYSKNSK